MSRAIAQLSARSTPEHQGIAATTNDQFNARAHRLGVNGVPSFVFDGPMVISGAQEPQILARMLDAAASAA